MEKKKKHADFQNEYRRSSNIGKKEYEEQLRIKGDGDLKLTRDEEMKVKSQDEKISEVMNDLLENNADEPLDKHEEE
ncbi:MAG: hypothetical protein GX163_06555 [Bacteroidetes bacterium]|jgi:hypothetical protein|nr:hypothetical protein [Bacteroidota bacterium]